MLNLVRYFQQWSQIFLLPENWSRLDDILIQLFTRSNKHSYMRMSQIVWGYADRFFRSESFRMRAMRIGVTINTIYKNKATIRTWCQKFDVTRTSKKRTEKLCNIRFFMRRLSAAFEIRYLHRVWVRNVTLIDQSAEYDWPYNSQALTIRYGTRKSCFTKFCPNHPSNLQFLNFKKLSTRTYPTLASISCDDLAGSLALVCLRGPLASTSDQGKYPKLIGGVEVHVLPVLIDKINWPVVTQGRQASNQDVLPRSSFANFWGRSGELY